VCVCVCVCVCVSLCHCVTVSLCHPGGAPALSGWAMTGWLGLRFVYLMTTSLALGAGAGLGIALLLKKLPLAGPHQVRGGQGWGGGGDRQHVDRHYQPGGC
jgi:hypothetical protein